ncbi:hypothetical protein LPB19_11625 [Marinobacter salinisoli]|uniref:Uncharacterized protein n=1 Tax=Marinobacter salinisoli TaxID=2769486 RepID=A0ABX7MQZ2_9GAMM|nr:hypothetical protein [Marinobacter salinisoli]QSP93845.1 hypothetical protein LPB19_11625 [Marinobacter salinisoli]
MLTDFDHLSIWEIAHRWHNTDPNTSDPDAPPLPVQDLLRSITNMQVRHHLPILTKAGVELKSERNFPSFSEHLAGIEKPHDLKNEDVWYAEMRETYFERKERWCKRHDEAAEGLEQCYKYRVYDKEKLDSIHLDRGIIEEFCRKKGVDLPDFWFTKEEKERFAEGEDVEDTVAKETSPSDDEEPLTTVGKIKQAEADRFWSRLTDAQRHRMLCREVAGNLWKADKTLTQGAIMDHPVIREYCGAKYYTDPNTVRNWIKDLDPRPEDKRRGRPKG